MQIAILGIDLGKNSCSVVGLDPAGRVVIRRRLRRDGVIKLAAGMSGCVMAMEVCCGAHHLGRLLRDHGHQVRLMSPENWPIGRHWCARPLLAVGYGKRSVDAQHRAASNRRKAAMAGAGSATGRSARAMSERGPNFEVICWAMNVR